MINNCVGASSRWEISYDDSTSSIRHGGRASDFYVTSPTRDEWPERQPRASFERLMRRGLRKHGFPEPVFQHWVTPPDYGPARLDCAYPDLKIGIEADSYKWHSSRVAFERDRARNREFASLGWIIIQTTKREIQRFFHRAAVPDAHGIDVWP